MTQTDNLFLNLFTPGIDSDQSFENYRMNLSGLTNSNMTLIDTGFGLFPSMISALATMTSASTAAVTSTLNSISGSISSINSTLDGIDARFVKLGDFSGSGQADFNSISGSYSHILILGVATGSLASGSDIIQNIGIDFNGNSSAGSYASTQWRTAGSYSGANIWETEGFYETTASNQIVIGSIAGQSMIDFGTAFFAFIPNYSGSAGLYKSAFGMSGFMGNFVGFEDLGYMSISTQGGYWKSTSPITRIRVFSGSSISTRYNFNAGTRITMYGLY